MLQKFEMHCHSKYSSDSWLEPSLILKLAKKRGLDGVAITDHDTIKGALAAKKLARQFGLKVIPSEEISTSQGHLIGYGLTENVESGLSPEDTIAEVHSQGGFACVVHPLDLFRCSALHGKPVLKVIKKLDMIEVYNARNFFIFNLAALNLARRHKLAMTAGSDAHLDFEVGHTWTLFEEGFKKLKPMGFGHSFAPPFKWVTTSLRTKAYDVLDI